MATQADFAAARQAATNAANITFDAAQAAYQSGDMAAFHRLIAEFDKAKTAEAEASKREIAALLHPITPGGDNALQTATATLGAAIDQQKAGAERANQIATGINLLLSAILLFAL